MKEMSDKKCVVCGARLTVKQASKPNFMTCSPICTVARKHGRTREEQMWEYEEQDKTEESERNGFADYMHEQAIISGLLDDIED